MCELVNAYPDYISPVSSENDVDEVNVCNLCLSSYVISRDGECCIGCNDEMTCCRACLPEKNTIHHNNVKLAFCDFCGATFKEDDTTIYDDHYYELVEAEYGISKEELIPKIKDLQKHWFRKEQMLDRIKMMISKLEMEIEDLQDEARYISSL